MKVYEKVRIYLDDNGLPQIHIAQKSGIPLKTFNDILNGKQTLYADELRAICLALNVRPEIFIECKACARSDARGCKS